MPRSLAVAVRCATCCGLLCLGTVPELAGQSIDAGRAGVRRSSSSDSVPAHTRISLGPALRRDSVFALPLGPRLRPYAPLISAVIPGGGQLALGDGRFVVYAVIEAIGWWNYQKNRSELAQETSAFKAIANGVGRSPFTAHPQDREWAYYEQMRDYKESGAYSMTETGPVVPEKDTLKFNGYKWQLALRNHATVAAALAEYELVAIKPDFQWSFKDHQLEYDIFKRTTALRNDASQRASNYLLAIAANHVLSMIDAFATIRLRVQSGTNGSNSIGASIGF